MSSSDMSTPSPREKRPAIKHEIVASGDQSSSSSSSPSPSKKPKNRATPKYSATKADAWTPELRLKLFEAYQSSSQVKWDEVASKVGDGKSAQRCREQWQRATGNKIRKALGEA